MPPPPKQKLRKDHHCVKFWHYTSWTLKPKYCCNFIPRMIISSFLTSKLLLLDLWRYPSRVPSPTTDIPPFGALKMFSSPKEVQVALLSTDTSCLKRMPSMRRMVQQLSDGPMVSQQPIKMSDSSPEGLMKNLLICWFLVKSMVCMNSDSCI